MKSTPLMGVSVTSQNPACRPNGVSPRRVFLRFERKLLVSIYTTFKMDSEQSIQHAVRGACNDDQTQQHDSKKRKNTGYREVDIILPGLGAVRCFVFRVTSARKSITEDDVCAGIARWRSYSRALLLACIFAASPTQAAVNPKVPRQQRKNVYSLKRGRNEKKVIEEREEIGSRALTDGSTLPFIPL